MSPRRRRREALRQFGDLEQHPPVLPPAGRGEGDPHAAGADARSTWWRTSAWAARGLFRAPVLALTIVATVGVGIGAHGRDLRRGGRCAASAAPVRRARSPRADLHRFAAVPVPLLGRGLPRAAGAADALRRHRHLHRPVDDLQRRRRRRRWRRAASCRGRYFRVLGIAPALGRDFSEPDGRPGSPPAGDRQPRLLAVAPRRPDGRARPAHPAGRRRLHAGGRPAARVGPLEQGQDFFVAQQFDARRPGAVPSSTPWSPASDQGVESAVCRAGAARDQQAHLPALEGVLPGRQGDVEHDGSQGARRRQRVARWPASRSRPSRWSG